MQFKFTSSMAMATAVSLIVAQSQAFALGGQNQRDVEAGRSIAETLPDQPSDRAIELWRAIKLEIMRSGAQPTRSEVQRLLAVNDVSAGELLLLAVANREVNTVYLERIWQAYRKRVVGLFQPTEVIVILVAIWIGEVN